MGYHKDLVNHAMPGNLTVGAMIQAKNLTPCINQDTTREDSDEALWNARLMATFANGTMTYFDGTTPDAAPAATFFVFQQQVFQDTSLQPTLTTDITAANTMCFSRGDQYGLNFFIVAPFANATQVYRAYNRVMGVAITMWQLSTVYFQSDLVTSSFNGSIKSFWFKKQEKKEQKVTGPQTPMLSDKSIIDTAGINPLT